MHDGKAEFFGASALAGKLFGSKHSKFKCDTLNEIPDQTHKILWGNLAVLFLQNCTKCIKTEINLLNILRKFVVPYFKPMAVV